MNDLSQKKLIIYIGLGIVLFGAGTLVTYFFLFRGIGAPAEPKEPEPVSENIPGFPEAGPGIGKDPRFGGGNIQPGSDREIPIAAGIRTRLFLVAELASLGTGLSRAEDKIYYFKKDGGELDAFSFPAGTKEPLSTITIVSMVNAFWSPTRDRAIVSYLDGVVTKSFLFKGIGTSSVATLPVGIRSSAWSPTGSSLVYLTEKDGETALATADSSGKNQKTIFRTPIRELALSWPLSEKFALQTNPSGVVPGYIFIFTRASGELTRFLGPTNGLTSLWSPKGEKLLTGSTNAAGKSLSLAIHDSSGKEIFRPDLQTLPEKCSWAREEKVYCAVPRGIPQDAILPDDYRRGELNTNDRLVAIDLKTKIVSGVFNDGGYDMADIVVTKDEKFIFFTDRITGKVWGLEVTQ